MRRFQKKVKVIRRMRKNENKWITDQTEHCRAGWPEPRRAGSQRGCHRSTCGRRPRRSTSGGPGTAAPPAPPPRTPLPRLCMPSPPLHNTTQQSRTIPKLSTLPNRFCLPLEGLIAPMLATILDHSASPDTIFRDSCPLFRF